MFKVHQSTVLTFKEIKVGEKENIEEKVDKKQNKVFWEPERHRAGPK